MAMVCSDRLNHTRAYANPCLLDCSWSVGIFFYFLNCSQFRNGKKIPVHSHDGCEEIVQKTCWPYSYLRSLGGFIHLRAHAMTLKRGIPMERLSGKFCLWDPAIMLVMAILEAPLLVAARVDRASHWYFPWPRNPELTNPLISRLEEISVWRSSICQSKSGDRKK